MQLTAHRLSIIFDNVKRFRYAKVEIFIEIFGLDGKHIYRKFDGNILNLWPTLDLSNQNKLLKALSFSISDKAIRGI